MKHDLKIRYEAKSDGVEARSVTFMRVVSNDEQPDADSLEEAASEAFWTSLGSELFRIGKVRAVRIESIEHTCCGN